MNAQNRFLKLEKEETEARLSQWQQEQSALESSKNGVTLDVFASTASLQQLQGEFEKLKDLNLSLSSTIQEFNQIRDQHLGEINDLKEKLMESTRQLDAVCEKLTDSSLKYGELQMRFEEARIKLRGLDKLSEPNKQSRISLSKF